MNKFTVHICGLDLVVHFLITGEDRAATWFSPPEFREIEIQKIMLEENDLYDLFDSYKIMDVVVQEIVDEFLK